jgi:hypothetical protein
MSSLSTIMDQSSALWSRRGKRHHPAEERRGPGPRRDNGPPGGHRSRVRLQPDSVLTLDAAPAHRVNAVTAAAVSTVPVSG